MSCVERVRVGAQDAFRIDLATQHDLLEVVELEEACQLSAWGWESYHAELARPEAIMLVARRKTPDWQTGKSLYGFVAARVTANELHVNNIGVCATARGCGIGNALLRATIATSRRLGARQAFLEVRANNVAAQALYQRCGFVVAGRRRNYYRAPAEDALVMRAVL